jgi:polar amino acid transport system substrate-binding protein
MTRQRTMKSLWAAITVLAVVCLSACGGSSKGAGTSGSADAQPTLRIGISADNPPMESVDPTDPSKLAGFDIDMAAAVFGSMHRKYTFTKIDFNGLIPALQAGHIDAIVSDLWVNAERSKAVDFVSYMKAAQSVMVRTGNPLGITTMDGLCGHRAAAKLGSVGQTALQAQSKTCTGDGKKAIAVQTFTTFPAEAEALAGGRIDATLEDALTTGGYIKTHSSSVDLGFVQDSGIIVAAAVKKGNSALAAQLQTAITAFQSDGGYDAAFTKYGIPANLKQPATTITNFTG